MQTTNESLRFTATLQLAAFTLEAAFEVEPGETVALIGPNGAGKSTCLKLIAGLVRPDNGNISVGGRVLFDSATAIDRAPETRKIGFVFQDYALFPHLNSQRNVEYGIPRTSNRSAMAYEWLDRLGVGDCAAILPGKLSGGQGQRVALARTLASKPDVLLLDEPFAALDASTRASVRAEVRDYVSQAGVPTVIVTHDPTDALVLGHRIIVMEAGQIVQQGTREELLTHPRTAFVADLTGVNLLSAIVNGDSAVVGGALFHVVAGEIEGYAFLSFSPSDIVLSGSPPEGSARNVFAATVTDVVPFANRVRVLLTGVVPLVAEVTTESATNLGLAPGIQVWASVKATSIRVYR